MKTDQMIDVTEVPLDALVRAAYRPSRAQGLGAFHYQPGDLTDEEVSQIVDRSKNSPLYAFSIDYLKGRSCKFHVFKVDDRRYIKNRWYDHSDGQLRDLLSAVGIDPTKLDAARKAQDDYEQVCLDKAVTFLRECGGTFTDESIETPEMEDVSLGFYVGRDRGVIGGEWKDRKQIWTLAA